MKKIYLTLALIAGLASASFAQLADLAAYVDLIQYECLNDGDSIQPDQNMTTQPYGRWGVFNLGPDIIDSSQTTWIATPYNKFVDSGLFFSGYKSRYADMGDPVILLSYLKVDSIKSLVNIDSFEAHWNDSARFFVNFMVSRQNLVDSQVYGFYLFNKGVGDNLSDPDNTDDDKDNNYAYVPIVWQCNAGSGNNPGGNTNDSTDNPGNTNGIYDMILEGARHIRIYPNPAKDELTFKYGFIKTTLNAKATIVDMTGRVVASKDLGSHNFGTKEFKMDISQLPEGNYLLQINTGSMNAVGKFTVRK